MMDFDIQDQGDRRQYPCHAEWSEASGAASI